MGVIAVRKVSHDISAVQANRVAACAESLELVDVVGLLALEGVAEGHSANDLARRELGGSIVNDHSTLRVSAEDDLGVRALLEGCFDEAGHFGPAGASERGISLNPSVRYATLGKGG